MTSSEHTLMVDIFDGNTVAVMQVNTTPQAFLAHLKNVFNNQTEFIVQAHFACSICELLRKMDMPSEGYQYIDYAMDCSTERLEREFALTAPDLASIDDSVKHELYLWLSCLPRIGAELHALQYHLNRFSQMTDLWVKIKHLIGTLNQMRGGEIPTKDTSVYVRIQ